MIHDMLYYLSGCSNDKIVQGWIMWLKGRQDIVLVGLRNRLPSKARILVCAILHRRR